MKKENKDSENSKTNEKTYSLRIEFENALILRNFEIDLFWKRVWFFGALLIATTAAYYELSKSTNPIIPVVCLSFVGCVIAISQSLMCRGSKYWQERWEYITKNRETALGIELTQNRMFQKEHESFYIHASILAKDENIITRSHRFSVSKLTFFVWDIISLSFFFIWIKDVISITSFQNADIELSIKLSIYYSIILSYSIWFWYNGKLVGKETFIKKAKKGETQIDYKKVSKNYIANKLSEL